MADYFISYTQADQAAAEWVAWELEEAGLRTVLQAWDFAQGGNYVLDMDRALREAQCVMPMLSPAFLASRYTAPEWASAFARDPTGSLGLLLPVRIKPCQLDGLLAQVVYIDLVGARSEAEMRRRLLDGVRRARRKPAQRPAAPALAHGDAAPGGADGAAAPGTAGHGAAPGGAGPQPADATADGALPHGPRPPWATAFDIVEDKAASLAWRLLRAGALALGAAVLVLLLLRSWLPMAADSEDSPQLALVAGVLGLAVMLAVEAVLRWWRRRQRSAGG